MAFVLELSAFSHHDEGDIVERHTLYSDPNAENVAILRDSVAEAFEMSGYLTQDHSEFDHYYHTPSDQETYAVGLKISPTLFDEEPGAIHLRNTLTALARFDLGAQHVPHARPPGEPRVLLLHSQFEHPPSLITPVAVGTSTQLKRQRERLETLLESLGFVSGKEKCEGAMKTVWQLEHRCVSFTDEPLEVNLGSSDTQLLMGLLNATALQELTDFSDNPQGLQALLKHGLLQWD